MPISRLLYGPLSDLVAVIFLLLPALCPQPAVSSTPIPTQTAHSSPSSLITGKVVRDLSYPGPRGLVMPTDVAVSGHGEVYVADGVNDRILRFDSSGEFEDVIEKVADKNLSRPMSVSIDDHDRLWIADTGNHRVVGVGVAKIYEKVISVGDNQGDAALDITDAAVSRDGRIAWLVANKSQVLVLADMETGRTRYIGQEGEAPGQVRYPFMLALGSEGEAFVTDVVNGRIVTWDAAGRPGPMIGTYGAGIGDLYRPEGIAVDAEGRVWVSDGVLRVVQVFSWKGTFLGVLRQEDGQPMRFHVPMGLAFGPGGDLYVAELGADRVRRVRLEIHAGEPAAPLTTPPDIPAAHQPRTCTACHLDWLYPLVNGQSTDFVKGSSIPPSTVRVGQMETCLSCHDGVAADSRQLIWHEKGHPRGAVLPKGRRVPADLPIPGGRIGCSTCHTAHTRPGPTKIAEAVTLRARQHPSTLCEGCHQDFGAGTSQGMHPLTEMKVLVPPELIPPLVGASNDRKVTCLVCHRSHGTDQEALLAASPATNQLCSGCHGELSPAQFKDGMQHGHAGTPVLNKVQRAVAAGFSTRMGSNGRLICMTCHRMHKARPSSHLLVFDPARPNACGSCHPAESGVINSSHDLRTNHPKTHNILGMTPKEGGPCSACHTAHRYARPTVPTPLDPKGRCITCHQADQVAAATRPGTVNHPKATCEKCHDPHEVRYAKYLPERPSDLCHRCHEPMVLLRGGPHDLKRDPRAWPKASAETGDMCLSCHRVHGDEQNGLFRMGLNRQVPRPDAACTACHPDARPEAAGERALVHPGPVTRLNLPTDLPVTASPKGALFIGCGTCHDPHAKKGSSGSATVLLRKKPGEGVADWGLCLSCHPQMDGIASTGHTPKQLGTAGFKTTGCEPCHAMHAAPGRVDANILMPERLLAEAKSSPLNLAADRYCVACHRPGGPVAPPRIATHRAVPMRNPVEEGQPGFLPLFNAKGEVDPNGTIGCRTCHLTHGRQEPGPRLPPGHPSGAREQRARDWRLRDFKPGNVCSVCHGPEALWRFLYFHEPELRRPKLPGVMWTD